MECTGVIAEIGRAVNNCPRIILEVNGISIPQLVRLRENGKLNISMKKYSGKRSLDANAYYWKLLSELARALNTSNEEMHNLLLESYGTLAEDNDGNMIVHFLPETEDYQRYKHEHYKPTGENIEYDGIRFYKFYRIKGSSQYNTREMSRLIDGLVYECQNMDIETLPPDQIERMMKAYAKTHDEKAGVPARGTAAH